MRRLRALAVATAIVAAISPAHSDVSLPSVFQILGSITSTARPVSNALVIALNLNSFEAVQTYSAADGSFQLPSLPAGVYKIIAFKAGLLPTTATLVPTQKDHRVNLRMKNEGAAKGKSLNQEIWEIRGSLPADVLREVDLVMASAEPADVAPYHVPRLKGEMISMTAVAQQSAVPAFAQTALGVQSRIGDTWQIGIRGDLQRIDDPTDGLSFGGDPLAQANTIEMELRSSPTDSYRLASTHSSWRYQDDVEGPLLRQRHAGVRSHDFQWEHGDARVNVRYFAHDNLFSTVPYGSDAIEIGGDTNVVHTRRNDVNVSLRVRQESVRYADMDPLRTADLNANGKVEVAPSFVVYYGMASRLGIDRGEWAPRTGIEWKLNDDTSFVASAAYKVLDEMPASSILVPSLVVWTDDANVLPRYSYTLGIVSSRDENNRFSAIATVSAADSPLRVVFSDGYQQFWDGLYVDTGDVRRDLRLAYRRDFGSVFAIDITTTAGTATPHATPMASARKVYIAGDLQTIFTPTRTTLAVTYREIQQPQAEKDDYHSSRMNVRMAQSLYLPIDVKLLLGIEMGRAENSPFMLDAILAEETSKKYIGGLAVNF
ncbi:MAG TPA: carboxypeptidase-like regulatory domain-containing protein [Thermoanaerobaculia bacterium]|nr:carboxypeptidase-like regulatory domain-containing protein [Thermoanaerobaculia bacterium]